MRALFLAAALLSSVAAPALAAEVNVYTTRQPELIKPVFDAFSAESGVAVNVVFAEKGVIERLQAEGRNTPADMVIMTSVGDLEAAKAAGVLGALDSDVLTAAIPAQYRDPQNMWFGLTARSRVAYVSKTVEDAPTRFADLTDEKWRGRICMRSGRHPYNIGLIAAMIAETGVEKTEAWLSGVKANLARTPQGNDRAQVKAIWSGECDVALGNTYYMGQMLADPEQQQWANSVNIDFLTMPNGGAHMNISGAGLTAHAPHPEEARALLEFMTTAEVQKLYAEANYEFPVRAGVSVSPIVKNWGDFTSDALPLVAIADHAAEALKIVDRVGFDE